MGWRDRDYARFTTAERERFLATSGARSTARRGRFGRTAAGGLLAVVAVSGILFGLGHYPKGNPIVPALHFSLSGIGSSIRPDSAPPITTPALRPTVTITGPKVVRVHSFLTFHGPVPIGDEGTVRVFGKVNHRPWRTLAVVDGSSGSYLARISADTRGTLRIRIRFKDGARAVETLHVR